MTAERELRGIHAVADELGVTHRALRFYEDKGLIEPQRVGTTRIYDRRAVARMRLILRGKRVGFSLREIKAFLELYDTDPQHLEHARLMQSLARERLDELAQRRAALDETIAELQVIEGEANAWLERAESTKRALTQ